MKRYRWKTENDGGTWRRERWPLMGRKLIKDGLIMTTDYNYIQILMYMVIDDLMSWFDLAWVDDVYRKQYDKIPTLFSIKRILLVWLRTSVYLMYI